MQGSGERSAISQAKAVKSATAKIVDQQEKAAERQRRRRERIYQQQQEQGLRDSDGKLVQVRPLVASLQESAE